LQAPGYDAQFTREGHALNFGGQGGKRASIRVELVGARTHSVGGLELAPGVVSYFKGPQSEWVSAVPTYAAIDYRQPWPGINLRYKGHGGRLESVYTVAAHADPTLIQLRYSGQKALKLDAQGDLVYSTAVGEVRETAPILYQEIAGVRVPVAGRYRLIDAHTVGFSVASYDAKHPLVIDPTLVYSGFMGGSGDDIGYRIAVDASGNAYVTGETGSPAGFPITSGTFDATFNGGLDAFVVKVNAAGTALVYATYLGGDGFDGGIDIAVDAVGNAYVCGYTTSTESTFPTLGGLDATYNGVTDGFVAKLNAAGSALLYSGYIGGTLYDQCNGIAIDAAGNAIVGGNTASDQTSFPELVGPDLSFNGGASDAFVAKINPAGSALLYAGYIGGSGNDRAMDIAVDVSGNAYLAGFTNSTQANFPVLAGPDLSANGGNDAFVAKLNPAGTALIYAGFIGGSGTDEANAIAIDSAGNAYVSGNTDSTEASFPVIVGPDLIANGGFDAFVAKLNTPGTALIYAGFIGGNSPDFASGIALDGAGNAYVGGRTQSTATSFPVLDGPDLSFNGATDAFVAKLNLSGSALLYATYLGGSGTDLSLGVAVDSAGSAYLTGWTGSTQTTFPVVGTLDVTQNGGADVFIAKLGGDAIFANGYE